MHSITKKWFVVHTRPRWEKKVAALLHRKNIEYYCPLNKVQKQWSDRKKIINEPLFSSYVFVCIDEAEQAHVRSTDGIINFVYWLGKPAVVRNEEILAIREFLHNYGVVQLEKTAINLNDIVRVIGGPLIMQKGKVISVKNKTIKVLLPSLGYLMHAEIETSNAELLTGAEVSKDAFNTHQRISAFK